MADVGRRAAGDINDFGECGGTLVELHTDLNTTGRVPLPAGLNGDRDVVTAGGERERFAFVQGFGTAELDAYTAARDVEDLAP